MAKRKTAASLETAYDAETLEMITEFGKLQFSIDEVAIIVGIEAAALEAEGAARLAYRKGVLQAEAEVRRSIYQMAAQGSSPAQREFLELIDRRRADGGDIFRPEDV